MSGNAGRAERRIVSSAHLVSEKGAELSELEYALNLAGNAYQRWITRCMTAAGQPDLGPLDVLVLHLVNHRDRHKKLAELCFLLNMEDKHTVNYTLKKLARRGLVAGEKRGKEIFYRTTDDGRETCERYRAVRESCLMDTLAMLGHERPDIADAARLLRALSGLYDQAARAATTL